MNYDTVTRRPRPLALIPTLLPVYARAKNAIRQNDEPVRKLARKVFKVLGDRLAVEDGSIVRRWCEIEILRSALFAETTMRGPVKPDGEPSGLVFAYTKLAGAQLALEKELGMSPRARIEIQASGRHAPLDIATAFALANSRDEAAAAEVIDGAEPDRES